MTTSGFVSRGHGAIAPFALTRATTVAQAAERLADGAMVHAGGIDVVSALRTGTRVDELVHVGGIDELRAISVDPDRGLTIGAAVTHHQLETDTTIAQHRPDLAAAWRTVGNARIRRSGTIGGNLLAFDPGYDAAPILAAAGARLRWTGRADGRTETGVADRADGSDETGMADRAGGDTETGVADRAGGGTETGVADRAGSTESMGGSPSGLLVAVEVPQSGRVLFDRSLKPMVSVAVGDELVAIGCAHGDVVVRPRPDPGDQQLDQWLARLPEPLDGVVASAPYRRRMIGVLTRRLLDRWPTDTGGERP